MEEVGPVMALAPLTKTRRGQTSDSTMVLSLELIVLTKPKWMTT
jgi:hypothetical protein